MRRKHSTSISSVWRSLWNNRSLTKSLTKRELIARYRGSLLGFGWSLLYPLAMLTVYTFVFKVIVKAKWAVETQSSYDFPILVFSGMIVHTFFSENIVRSSTLIVANSQYVKKVVFPLEILSWISVLTGLVHLSIGFLLLVTFFAITHGEISWTVIFFPVIVFPLVVLTLGVSWFLSSATVYLRDISQITGVLATVFLFISPVFYPVVSVPEPARSLMYLNPLTYVIETIRKIVVWGEIPTLESLAFYYLSAFLAGYLGYLLFQKTRKNFADIV